MRICQVISSNMPILPTGERGWGATELITDEYAKNLRALGHHVDVRYLNEVRKEDYDIVHIHVAKLCLEAEARGIPYVYSTHDHHSFFYGKDSFNYKQQLKAMKGSIFSIAPAEYVVDYFDDTDKLFYLTHGADTSYYTPAELEMVSEFRLLMCANNGVAGDYGADRKGFRFGIEAARALNLPITIVGADANTKFFEIHRDLLSYERLTVIDTNPTEREKVEIFKSHHIFLHPSNLEYGHPNLTLCEAASCCLPIVGTYRGSRPIPGLHVIPDISAESVTEGVRATMAEYFPIRNHMLSVRDSYDWRLVCRTLARMYESVLSFHNLGSSEIADRYGIAYEKTTKRC